MSVRAYRVKKLEIDDKCSFNIWHDEGLCEFLDIYSKLNEDGCGIIEVDIKEIERALKELELEDYRKKALERDLKEAKKNNEDYILYYCY